MTRDTRFSHCRRRPEAAAHALTDNGLTDACLTAISAYSPSSTIRARTAVR